MPVEAIKLGVMPPFTGLVSIYGSEISRAAQIACQEVNEKGGVLGRSLQLVIEDDGSLPESAVAAAEKLLVQHHCSAIIGNLLSNSRIAVVYRVAEPRRIPLLNFSFYEGSILSRYFFHFAALPNQQINLMIPYMREKFGPRMFFAGNNYEWPRGSIHAAKVALERAGGKIVGEEYCPIGVDTETIERLLDNVEAAAPDVFVPYFAGADQMKLLTRFSERGLKQRCAVVMGHYDEVMSSLLPPGVREGFYSSNTYFMSVESVENRDYLSRLAKFPGVNGIWPNGNGIVTNFGEGTYICVKAFAQAANLAGSLDPEALVEALKNITLKAPQGTVKMNSVHHHARVNAYLTQCKHDGTFTIIEKFGAIEPVIPERYKHQQINQRATVEEDIRLQARMLEQMSEGILLVSTQDGSILYTNPGAEKLFGYDTGELIGLSIVILNDPGWKDPLQTSAEIVRILNQSGEWRGEIRNIRKDGTPIWCSVSVMTFTHPVYGEVWLGVHRNITKRKQIEKELNESREFADSANQAKSKFLANMSHEIRTPMNGIIGISELLQTTKLTPQQSEYVEMVLFSAQHLLNIINEILDFSKIEANHLVLDPVDFILRHEIEKILEPLELHARSKGLQMRVLFADDLPHSVHGDPTRLAQILVNLVGNAIKFTESGTIEVVLSTEQNAAADTCMLHFAVRDSGIGIAPDKIDSIFEAFSQADGSITRTHGGTGLGLAISQRLVELMDGHIWATSTVGQGSTFHFTVRLGKVAGLSIAGSVNTTAKVPAQRALKLLLAEDNKVNQLVAVSILTNAGHTVSVADNGEEAVNLASSESFDAILMDVRMPVVDGFAATRQLRKLGFTLPVIALTAHAMNGFREECLQHGMNDYLSKPFHINDLLAKLNQLAQATPLAGRQSIDQAIPVIQTATQSTLPIAVDEGLDIVSARETSGGDIELLKKMLVMVSAQIDEEMPILHKLVASSMMPELVDVAHRLKGSLAAVGAYRALDACGKLETLARENQASQCVAAMQHLDEQIVIARRAIATAIAA